MSCLVGMLLTRWTEQRVQVQVRLVLVPVQELVFSFFPHAILRPRGTRGPCATKPTHYQAARGQRGASAPPRGARAALARARPTLDDLQAAWLLLQSCAAPRANYLLRILPPHLTADYAAAHHASVARCLAALLEQGETPLPPTG